MKYDNCKGCANKNCEHYNKNREFVCIGGESCKVVEVKCDSLKELIKSFEWNYERANTWIITALTDIGKWTDKLVPFDSICTAHEYTAKARQDAVIIACYYRNEEYLHRSREQERQLNDAHDAVRKGLTA